MSYPMITAWQAVSSAPHRLFFLAGALQAVLGMLLWTALLAARHFGLAPELALPQPWLHAWLMLFGLFPFFVTGFTLTAVPNWLGESGVPRRTYLGAFLPMAGGALLVHAGLWLGKTAVLAGMLAHGIGWAWATLAVGRLIAASRHPGKRHFHMAIAVIVCGLLAEAACLLAFARETPALVAAASTAALWLFLVPTFFSISHRIIPAFTRMAIPEAAPYQPLWMLPAMTACCLLHCLLDLAGARGWLWLADLPLALVALQLVRKWRSPARFAHPLIGIHHLSFAWLPVALLLFALQSLLPAVALGQAPLHALVAGYFGSMLLGTSARVVVAHAGGPIEFPASLRRLFVLYQAVPLLRIAGEVTGLSPAQANLLYVLAGLAWLAAWGGWLAHLLPRLFSRQR
jgi:uncharacterized protein involved in response to NO